MSRPQPARWRVVNGERFAESCRPDRQRAWLVPRFRVPAATGQAVGGAKQ